MIRKDQHFTDENTYNQENCLKYVVQCVGEVKTHDTRQIYPKMKVL